MKDRKRGPFYETPCMTWLSKKAWFVIADWFCSVATDLLRFSCVSPHITLCNFLWVFLWLLYPRKLCVFLQYVLSQFLHGILYTHLQTSFCLRLSVGCTSRLEWFHSCGDTTSSIGSAN